MEGGREADRDRVFAYCILLCKLCRLSQRRRGRAYTALVEYAQVTCDVKDDGDIGRTIACGRRSSSAALRESGHFRFRISHGLPASCHRNKVLDRVAIAVTLKMMSCWQG